MLERAIAFVNLQVLHFIDAVFRRNGLVVINCWHTCSLGGVTFDEIAPSKERSILP